MLDVSMLGAFLAHQSLFSTQSCLPIPPPMPFPIPPPTLPSISFIFSCALARFSAALSCPISPKSSSSSTAMISSSMISCVSALSASRPTSPGISYHLQIDRLESVCVLIIYSALRLYTILPKKLT